MEIGDREDVDVTVAVGVPAALVIVEVLVGRRRAVAARSLDGLLARSLEELPSSLESGHGYRPDRMSSSREASASSSGLGP